MTQQLSLAPGDAIVYPKHGAGFVRGRTQRTALGQTQEYYDIELRSTGMQVLVPVAKAQALGLRRVTPEARIPELLNLLGEPDLDLPSSFPQRIRVEQGILDLADIEQVARLLGTLARRAVQRGLADSEGQVMRACRGMLSAEVAVSLGVLEDEAARLLDARLP
ncbi:CarD family transcriptional regulator [Deinococcus yavapaiensis]|uniref:CarD family transcriptional regulator n=1 Tax=Deinococcus yavapaiensis KR-236 TaxID=694435 RepID=A0A318S1J2_9DEIO|nr:CarD family transcriptional regulator [Deinococcus yavapaiensis]PYE51185.1 CarD family transcriptional regulator [Deinococcus yavapaiensis KR-236]